MYAKQGYPPSSASLFIFRVTNSPFRASRADIEYQKLKTAGQDFFFYLYLPAYFFLWSLWELG